MINFYYGTQKLIDRCKKINITAWLVKKMVPYFKLKGMPDIVKRSEFLGIKLSTIELRVTLNKNPSIRQNKFVRRNTSHKGRT